MVPWYSNVLLKHLWQIIAAAVISTLTITLAIGWYFVTVRSILPLQAPAQIIDVNPGDTIKQVSLRMQTLNLIPSWRLVYYYAYFTRNTAIKSGEYLLQAPVTIAALLQKLQKGEVIYYKTTLVPGWHFGQITQALQQAAKLSISHDDLAYLDLNNPALRQLLPFYLANKDLDGLFWPETYMYKKGDSISQILYQANQLMQAKLQVFWAKRPADCPLKDMYAALILASIIEKETAYPSEYARIAGVFQRRLHLNMRLQADPTVAYAWFRAKGEWPEVLTKEHLRFASPYNTYQSAGLPPGPIAIPSAAALEAALHPATGSELYFVANPSTKQHLFADTLAQHIANLNYVRRSTR
jgi:UPF0755 protein